MYRVKQFIWAFISIFKPIDSDIVDKYLDKDEKILFNKLTKGEKHHSIRVCKLALDYDAKEINRDRLGKIALLHDIGKITCSLNFIEKSIVVILDKTTKGKLKKYSNFKKIDIYYNHPIKGFDILKKDTKKYDKEFLEVVRGHHRKDSNSKNKYLDIITTCDNLC